MVPIPRETSDDVQQPMVIRSGYGNTSELVQWYDDTREQFQGCDDVREPGYQYTMENTDGLKHTLVPDFAAMHGSASKGESSDIIISGDALGSTHGPGDTLGGSKSSGGRS